MAQAAYEAMRSHVSSKATLEFAYLVLKHLHDLQHPHT